MADGVCLGTGVCLEKGVRVEVGNVEKAAMQPLGCGVV